MYLVCHDCGDCLNSSLHGQVRQLVDVDDGEMNLAFSRGDRRVQSKISFSEEILFLDLLLGFQNSRGCVSIILVGDISA